MDIITCKFNKLVSCWKYETAGLSSPRAISQHPCYLEIIEMDKEVLPLIFYDLENNGGWWFPALRVITGVNPVSDDARGNIALNTEQWLKWANDNQYTKLT